MCEIVARLYVYIVILYARVNVSQVAYMVNVDVAVTLVDGHCRRLAVVRSSNSFHQPLSWSLGSVYRDLASDRGGLFSTG